MSDETAQREFVFGRKSVLASLVLGTLSAIGLYEHVTDIGALQLVEVIGVGAGILVPYAAYSERN